MQPEARGAWRTGLKVRERRATTGGANSTPPHSSERWGRRHLRARPALLLLAVLGFPSTPSSSRLGRAADLAPPMRRYIFRASSSSLCCTTLLSRERLPG